MPECPLQPESPLFKANEEILGKVSIEIGVIVQLAASRLEISYDMHKVRHMSLALGPPASSSIPAPDYRSRTDHGSIAMASSAATAPLGMHVSFNADLHGFTSHPRWTCNFSGTFAS